MVAWGAKPRVDESSSSRTPQGTASAMLSLPDLSKKQKVEAASTSTSRRESPAWRRSHREGQ